MKESSRIVLAAVVAASGGMALEAGVLHAQQAPAKSATPVPATQPAAVAPMAGQAASVAVPLTGAPREAVPGTLQVTRLSDTSFVVVKDTGDAQVITLFATDGGIIQKKHTGKFFY